jgi:hypothetical protein
MGTYHFKPYSDSMGVNRGMAIRHRSVGLLEPERRYWGIMVFQNLNLEGILHKRLHNQRKGR